jgi:hypothetical protein
MIAAKACCMRHIDYKPPTFFGVAYASRLFSEIETSGYLTKFREITQPMLDLGEPKHRRALLQFLNDWGCRINQNSFDNISKCLAEWFRECGRQLPQVEIHNLKDPELEQLTRAYRQLIDIKGFGPTAASKALFALCPHAAIPWDSAIQEKFSLGGREPKKYQKMLIRSAEEAEAVIADAARHGTADSRMIPQAIQSQALTLTELLDQYHWVIITRRHKVPTSGELARWIEWTSREIAG